jgi:hypothetical protein
MKTVIGLLVLVGCGPIPERGADENVEPLRELIIVDELLLSQSRAASALDSAWTFASAVAHALPADADVGSALEGAVLPAALLCTWLRALPENGCTRACDACAQRTLSPASAPLRLAAVVYRPDLGLTAEGVISPGEGRLVFVGTSGPADDPASTEVPATIALEYRLPGTAIEWARAWHAMGQASSSDAAAHLAAIVSRFAERDDGRAPQLARVRANDALDGAGVLREWVLDTTGRRFVPGGLPNTPRPDIAGETLEHFATEHRAEVLIGRHQLPREWLAIQTDVATPPPALRLEDEALVRAFGVATCNGCHGSLTTNVGGFHIAPGLVGARRLSEFLLDPERRAGDELTRRADALRLMLRQ